MGKITVSQIINYSLVRYGQLKNIVDYEYRGSQANTIVLYLDLYSIMKPLYHTPIFIENNTNELASCIINMAAHYRFFFRTRYGVESTIYLINSNISDSNYKKAYDKYNSKTEYVMQSNKVVSNYINYNMDLVRELAPYIPDVMYVIDKVEPAVIAKYLAGMSYNAGKPGIFITRDPYNFQLASDNDDIKVLVPYKTKDPSGMIDRSYMVSESNSILYYLNKMNCNNNETYNLSGGLLPLIMALSRVPSRNIDSMYNLPKAVFMVKELVANNSIPNGHIYSTEVLGKDAILKGRYFVCDVYSQLVYYSVDPGRTIVQPMVNLSDSKAVKEINNKYFIKYPLDLDGL